MRAISFLIIYYPFHEFLLKLSGLSGVGLFLLRQWPDVAIIFIFLFLAFLRASQGGLYVRTQGFCMLLLMFLVWSIFITVIISDNNIGVAFSEVFVLLRFTLVFGIVVMLSLTQERIDKIINIILISSVIQGLIGVVQFLGGPAIVEFFKPVDYTSIITDVERSFTANRENAKRLIIGTTGDFISLAYMLAIGIFATFSSSLSKRNKSMILTAGFTILLLSGSRTIFLGTAIAVISFGLITQKLGKRLAIGLLLLAIISPSVMLLQNLAQSQVYEYSNFLSLFDARIFESLINQRLGVAVFVMPEFIVSGDFILGLSPDRFYVAEVINNNYEGIPSVIHIILPFIIEDVYVLALFLYYGLPGVIILTLILLKLYNIAKRVYRYVDVKIGAISIMMLIALTVFSFGNQVLENRIFAFHFWLIMGLCCSSFTSRERVNAHTTRS